MSTESRAVVVASFPRSGTHLTIDTLRANFETLNISKLPLQRTDRTFVNIDHVAPDSTPRVSSSTMIKRLSGKRGVLIKTHSKPGLWEEGEILSTLMQKAGRSPTFIYVLRHPIKVMLSAWEYVRLWDKDAPRTFANFIHNYPSSALIPWESRPYPMMEGWARHLIEWTSKEEVLVVNSETLSRNPSRILHQISDKIGVPLPRTFEATLPPLPEGLLGRLWRRLSPRPTSTAVLGLPRPAVPEEDVEYIKNQANILLPRQLKMQILEQT
ncbi:MAG: hypothetical protein P8Z49_04940 [Acidobacteriota bacterium]